ncbi:MULTISPECIES: beta-glucosidase BglX [unclassified Herbaspirillum]|uniref:beta-glucosidase BglX n=1 Tax=unclassified Herbaspirillum TaxID=2624150 RepID=UPI00114FAC7A|nr:beta-glucosidase [Herbaspirillum sp. SJZ102]TQK00011.1 beta-glucosidase [Herbaspirillum sp. SJZ130]TQK04665.1 beta-glucosidase [Herbaspirillum sp. SJZ106]
MSIKLPARPAVHARRHRRTALLCALACAAALLAPQAHAQGKPALLGDKGAFIDDLMSQMTVDEKIGQLRLVSIGPDMPANRLADEIAAGRVGGTFNSVTRADNRPLQDGAMRSRLKIPMFFAYDVIHGHRTTFPIGLGLASSWDLDVVAAAMRTAAEEASADGIDMTFAPMVDISRDPRWGRTSEGFGEDPYLVSRIAEVSVRALQGEQKPIAANRLMASVKHFALYGAVEGGRDYNVVNMDAQRMYNDYLPPYRAAVDAGAGAVMVALNSINGTPATSNTWLLQDLLRREWGFKGLTVSDHGAITELVNHGVARDEAEAAQLSIKAGTDMSMADQVYISQLPGLLKSGKVTRQDLDNAVREILGAKYDMGLFHDPYVRIGQAAGDPPNVNAESRLHRAAARAVAQQSMVLLENRNATLPLKKSGTIALVGPLADSHIDMLGSWSGAGVDKQTVTLRQGLQDALGARAKLVYARGANITEDRHIVDYLNFLNWDDPEVVQDKRRPQAMIAEAVKAARNADVVVVAVGESRGMSHESSSRTQLTLPENQMALLKALKATGKPLVLVLMNGRPLDLNWARENASAILETWYTGTEGGHAIADILFGDVNPSGKLPITFPRSVGQIPSYYNHARLGRPFTEGKPGNYTSQYFEEPNGPLYPFGYGLSYTDFSLSGVTMSQPTMKADGRVDATVTVKNTGRRAGATVVQLYIRDVAASVVRPVKELKDFRKVLLQPGEQKEVRFTIDARALSFYNARLEHVAEPGEFQVQVGLDSKDVKTASFTLE